jgi:hypothetical protein
MARQRLPALRPPGPQDLTPERQPGPTDPGAVAGGIVIKGAASLTDVIQVRTPAFSERTVHTVRRWMPRPAEPNVCDGSGHPEWIVPQKDDECVVVFTEQAEPWVPAWWPN